MQTVISIVFWVMVIGSVGYEVFYLIQRSRFKKWLKEHPPETWPHPEESAEGDLGDSVEGFDMSQDTEIRSDEDEFL